MANAFLSLLHEFGVNDLKSFGDSTGEFVLHAPRGAAPAAAAQQR